MPDSSAVLALPARIATTARIRAIEAHFLADAQPPLMERAGRAAARLATDLLAGRAGPTVLLAGPGNNGGDAAVVARLLRAQGQPVILVCASAADALPPDARAAFDAHRAAGGEVVSELPDCRTEPALVVDGLFGIGLRRPVEGLHTQWIDWINRRRCPVLALDIPSGLDADSGRRLGATVRASHTISFIAFKPGLLTLDGPDCCGEITVHDLDLPLAADPEPVAGGHTLAPGCYAQSLRPRPRNCHKGQMGDAVVIGGAAGMVGAALLAGRAALSLGAGRVFVGMLAPDAPAVDPLQPELMLRRPDQALGLASALAVGPGLGQSRAAVDLLDAAVARDLPLLLDADALNLLASHPVLASRVARRAAPTLLTPHPAEAARLLGCDSAHIQADRVASALEIAARFRSMAVLKGCGSVVASPDARWWINRTGNPGMASAGMGDVLSGMALALLAQGWEARAALLAAVHLHGAAADALVARSVGPLGLAAGELVVEARSLLNRQIALASASAG
jgi:hydroxyethylthiazole kinase-like uncharacterized protein yjeF